MTEIRLSEINISANSDETHRNVLHFMDKLENRLREEHEYKLATYGFVQRSFYLLKFHTKNWFFRVTHRDLFK